MEELNFNSLTSINTRQDEFSKTVDDLKEKAQVLDKKTYTLTNDNIKYIKNKADQLSKENDKSVVTASAALRVILREHKEMWELLQKGITQ